MTEKNNEEINIVCLNEKKYNRTKWPKQNMHSLVYTHPTPPTDIRESNTMPKSELMLK